MDTKTLKTCKMPFVSLKDMPDDRALTQIWLEKISLCPSEGLVNDKEFNNGRKRRIF